MNPMIKDAKFYAVYAALVLDIGGRKTDLLFEKFGSCENFYRATPEQCCKALKLGKRQSERKQNLTDADVFEILQYCEQHKIRVITREDEEFLYRLRAIENAPLVLYLRGRKLNDGPSIGIVGTRHPTEFGCKAAYSLAAKLSCSGFTVVSGGALGIDSLAHYGAIKAGGNTVMVLGCGIDSTYLSGQQNLRRLTEQNGTLLSELPPKASPMLGSFPVRNRLISAMSNGVAIVEAGEKSGALITAGYAMEQGRELFAVPGSIDVAEYRGSNVLIREGATPLISVEDITEVYATAYPEVHSPTQLPNKVKSDYYKVVGDYLYNIVGDKAKTAQKVQQTNRANQPPKKTANPAEQNALLQQKTAQTDKPQNTPTVPEAVKRPLSGCSQNAAAVYAAFEKQTEVTDLLSSRSGITGGAFIAALSELEILGYIQAVPVGRYKII